MLTANRRSGATAVTVPCDRLGKDENPPFPRYDSSTLGGLVKTVSNLNINKLRSLGEGEMKRKIGDYDLPKKILYMICSAPEEVSVKFRGNPH